MALAYKTIELYEYGTCITLGCSYLFSNNEENNLCKAATVGTKEASGSDDGNQEGGAEPKVSIYTMARGIELQNVRWGALALSVAREVLQQYSSYMESYAFMITPPGMIRVRLGKLPETSNRDEATGTRTHGEYALKYWKRLKEVEAAGLWPTDYVSLEVVLVRDAESYTAAGRVVMINMPKCLLVNEVE